MIESYIHARDHFLKPGGGASAHPSFWPCPSLDAPARCEAHPLARSSSHSISAMYPSAGVIHLAPFSDEALYLETLAKGAFFDQGELYGVDLSVLSASATEEVFQQPVVGLFAPGLLTASATAQHVLDFTTVSAEVRRRPHPSSPGRWRRTVTYASLSPSRRRHSRPRRTSRASRSRSTG